MLQIQGDVFSIGGKDNSWSWKSAIYQLSCSAGICSWATLNQGLNVARYDTVAISVPDSFCLKERDGTTPSGSGGTCNQDWKGDAYCDDINNNVGCNFDGGDCCGANVSTYYCTACLCLEEDGTTPSGNGGTTTSPTITTTSGACNQGWIGDDYCDDINNNVGCNFDGGDCCGANVNTDYCDECLCIEE